MRDMEVRSLEDWCDRQGGKWKEIEEDTQREWMGDDKPVSHRCVLNEEGIGWDMRNGDWNIRDKEYVQIDHTGEMSFRGGDVLELLKEEWETFPEEDWDELDVDNPEQHNYSEEEVDSWGLYGELMLNAMGDELTAISVGQLEDRTQRIQIHAETTKSPEGVRKKTNAREDLNNERRSEQWERFKRDARSENVDVDEGDLYLRGLGRGESRDQWLKNSGLWEEFKDLTEESEPEPEYDEFECPDNADLVEIENDVTVDGRIEDIRCRGDDREVLFTGDDGKFYKITGNQSGSQPVRLEQNGQYVTDLTEEDFEFFTSQRQPSL